MARERLHTRGVHHVALTRAGALIAPSLRGLQAQIVKGSRFRFPGDAVSHLPVMRCQSSGLAPVLVRINPPNPAAPEGHTVNTSRDPLHHGNVLFGHHKV